MDTAAAISVFIGLGSNLNNPIEQIKTAIAALKLLPKTEWMATSSFYRSRPLPPMEEQPDFINAVVALKTFLSAHQLLQHLQIIEQQQGRTRHLPWAARTLDLDLLLYGNETIHTCKLIVPHPGLLSRHFVLYPLAEIAPDACLPSGETIRTLCKQCDKKELILVS
jgi:2-amino-4-hydroxy-6-hydroxymethyldihydropteridine diphosphokinase